MDEKHSLLTEFWHFLKNEKKFWIIPLLLVIVALGAVLMFVQGSPLAPFLYPLF